MSLFYDISTTSSVESLTSTIESILCCPPSEDDSNAINSPVLGIPRTIYWLILRISRQCRKQSRTKECWGKLRRLDSDLQMWEHALRPASDIIQADQTHFDGMARLYIYCARLILTWLCDTEQKAFLSRSEPVWQCLQDVVTILRHADESLGIARRFLLRWPLLILGHAVTSEKEVNLLEGVLRTLWEVSKWGDVKMTWEKIKSMWQHQKNFNVSNRQRLHLLLKTSG
ncbi:hypothetical protein LTR84_011482 [Exophiala bonariae]|uniref:Fungal STAND N-terminal Goodbye domain-containing protein n=1 Tax=Exophiala bonariae TaxID=1690606 RepID=A0AAV9NH71_9EURO|nr:hypothetical protein LTR84_011482 [Exophiala bonariae]